MTAGFLRALKILEERRSGVHPEEFFALMWPEAFAKGQTVGGRSLATGNTNGGPNRAQCAANWLLGRIARSYPDSVFRVCNLDPNRIRAGRWFISPAGRSLLRVAK